MAMQEKPQETPVTGPAKIYAALRAEADRNPKYSYKQINEDVQALTDYDSLAELEAALGVEPDRGLLVSRSAQAPPEPSRLKIFGESLQAVGLGAADMATFGFADEIAGGVRGAVTGVVPGGAGFKEGYEEGRDRHRAEVAEAKEDYGLQFKVGQGVGMVPLIAGGGALAGGRAAVTGARSAVPLLGRVAGGGVKVGLGGAAGGAAYGVGAGETAQERLSGGAEGAVFGGVVGAGMGALGPVVGAGAARFLRTPAGSRARAEARRMFEYALARAGVSTDDIMTKMDQLGPDATMADVDDILREEATAIKAVKAGGDTEDRVVAGLRERERATGGRIADDLGGQTRTRTTLVEPDVPGIPNTATETMVDAAARIKARLAQARAAGYQKLEKMYPEVKSVELDIVVGDSPLILQKVKEVVPDYKPGHKFSFRELQEIEQRVREEAFAPEMLARPSTGREWTRQADRLNDTLDDMLPGDPANGIPSYRDANMAYAKVREVERALEQGYKLAKKPLREQQQYLGRIERSNPEALDAYRTGAYEYWTERLLAREGAGGGPGLLVEAGSKTREKLRPLFESDEALDRFFAKMQERERVFKDTHRQVLHGSQTAEKATAIDAFSRTLPKSKKEAFDRVKAFLRPEVKVKIKDETLEELLNLYLTQGPEAAARMAAELNGRFGGFGRRGLQLSTKVEDVTSPRFVPNMTVGQAAARSKGLLED